jgi:hypothetical protein
MGDLNTQLKDPPGGISTGEFWAELQKMNRETERILQETALQVKETDRQMKETDRQMKETDRQMKETALQMKETDRKIKETDRIVKETARQMKETDRKISRMGNRIGELIEHIITPNIVEKFNKKGFVFGRIGPNVCYKGKDNRTITEVDILLENGDIALAVEVKSKLTIADVQEHVERMEKLRRYADNHGDKRRLMGAVAGAVIPDGVKPFAFKNGFYVIEQTGDTVTINAPKNFIPREW